MDYIIASGPVIIKNGEVLLIKDRKDPFYKFPGGTVKEGHGLKETCLRETKEEIGVKIKIIKPLETMLLWKKPHTGEKIPVVLVHWLAKIVPKQKVTKGKDILEVVWLNIKDINKYDVAPNVKYVLESL